MVSKTILFSLAAFAATICMVQGTGVVDLSVCAHALNTISSTLNLGLDIGGLLGGVLDVAGNLIASVLGGGSAGVLGGGAVQTIPGPTSLEAVLGLGNTYSTVLDKAFVARFGAAGWPAGLFVGVYANILGLVKLGAGVNLGSLPFVASAPALNEVNANIQVALNLLGSNPVFKSGPWAAYGNLLNVYLGLLNGGNVSADVLVNALGLTVQLNAALASMAGFQEYNSFITTNFEAFNPYLTAAQLTSLEASQYGLTNITPSCGCLKA